MNDRQPPPPIIGISPVMQRARELVERYARTSLPILFYGPTGSGKDLFAQHVHFLSGRPGDLVDVNCGALPREMIESLLFGHGRGAFTGAHQAVPGYVERANGTTLFLDELQHLPEEGQVKLLRVLESGTVERLGECERRSVDLRIVTAVQEDLGDRLRRGTFRSDLYHRLSGVAVSLSPLVERPEDIEIIASHFLAQQGRVLEAGCDAVLQRYSWPGNVRELKMVIERAGHLARNGTLSPAVLAEAIAMGGEPVGQDETQVADTEVARILAVCVETNWHARVAADRLGVHRTTLFRRLRALGVSLRGRKKVAMMRDAAQHPATMHHSPRTAGPEPGLP